MVDMVMMLLMMGMARTMMMVVMVMMTMMMMVAMMMLMMVTKVMMKRVAVTTLSPVSTPKSYFLPPPLGRILQRHKLFELQTNKNYNEILNNLLNK